MILNRIPLLEETKEESIFLWGARQTGKSTLLKRLFRTPCKRINKKIYNNILYNNNMEKIKKELPETIKYKRGNIFIIILGYLFALVAGVNGIESIHDFIYQWMGVLNLGIINRAIVAVGLIFIYIIIKWSFKYMCAKEYTPDDNKGMFVHFKYDSFTRTNGLLILIVFLLVTLIRGLALPW